jgi:hypothetical protein
VDFAPPVGYQEPTQQSRLVSGGSAVRTDSQRSMKIDEHTIEDASKLFSAFGGKGARLSGKPLSAQSPIKG